MTEGAVSEGTLTEAVRLAIYRSLAATGRLPRMAALAGVAGGHSAAHAAIARLATQRAVALDPDGAIALAHPFATRSFGFSVMSETTLWWGGCAWDSSAIPHLVPDAGTVVVATDCPGCGAALAWNVGIEAPPSGDEIAHFLVPTSHIWDDVIHTCGHQRLYCGDACIDSWLTRTGNAEGYRLDLATLWRLAAGWYAGRLDEGYRRREPSEASAYFREVGLSGPFWGLPDD